MDQVRRQRGASLLSYVIILGLVVLGGLVGAQLFGFQVMELYIGTEEAKKNGGGVAGRIGNVSAEIDTRDEEVDDEDEEQEENPN